MTVLQIVKALAGEQDINWGDSDTTFSRQTRTGSTTSINYVDSKSIPANSLGGVIDTHLHTQNTDTGTTAETFIIDSDADSATLSTTGLSADRTFTFPNTQTTQSLVGATDLALTTSVATGGAKTVGVYDVAGHFTATTVEAALAENAVAIAAILLPYGYKRGFTLSYIAAGIVALTRGMWHHAGTTDQMVYSSGTIAYTAAGLSGDQLQYLYLDDSAIASAGTAVITGTQLTNSVTPPSFSNTKFGWYNGNDRCIGAFVVLSGSILRFKIFSNDYYAYYTAPVLYTAANSPTSDTSLDFAEYVPIFSTGCRISIQHATSGDQISFKPATGWAAKTQITVSDTSEYQDAEVQLDTDQTVLWSTDTDSQTIVSISGYHSGDL